MQQVIITGANTGLGRATAKHLLQQGYAVTLACRDPIKASAARQKLEQETGSKLVDCNLLDLASMQNIRAFVEKTTTPPYGLICNAGIQYSQPTLYTKDGIELTFGVNVLGHFLLTNLLLSKFKSLERIAFVSSAAHDPRISGKRFGEPAFTTPELLAHPNNTSQTDWNKIGNTRYVTSKLCDLFLTYKLHALLRLNNRNNVLVNAFNPGLMAGTGLGRNSKPGTKFVWYYLLPLLRRFIPGASTPAQSGELLAKLITTVNESGKYFSLNSVATSSPESYDQQKMDLLWKGCEQLTCLQDNEKWYKA